MPLVLAIGGFWLNQIQKSRDERAAEQRDKTERDIAEDNQQEAALQAYLDGMSELLLEKKLRESQSEDEVRTIARIRTLTVLSRLDKKRKKSVLQFLHESKLIVKDKRIIKLSGALIGVFDGISDLRWIHLENDDLAGVLGGKADLSRAHLSGAKLSGARLSGVDLSSADLCDADLRDANLRGANLSGANLSGANLVDVIGITAEELEKQALSLKDAIMPDGSKHP